MADDVRNLCVSDREPNFKAPNIASSLPKQAANMSKPPLKQSSITSSESGTKSAAKPPTLLTAGFSRAAISGTGSAPTSQTQKLVAVLTTQSPLSEISGPIDDLPHIKSLQSPPLTPTAPSSGNTNSKDDDDNTSTSLSTGRTISQRRSSIVAPPSTAPNLPGVPSFAQPLSSQRVRKTQTPAPETALKKPMLRPRPT